MVKSQALKERIGVDGLVHFIEDGFGSVIHFVPNILTYLHPEPPRVLQVKDVDISFKFIY